MTQTARKNSPLVLCILDGWANNPSPENNAVIQAATPCFDALCHTHPTAELMTCGAFVGLPDGQMGNSEVGHTNIGAGRVVMQDLPRINRAMADHDLAHNQTLLSIFTTLKNTGNALHLLGLVSDGGVHAHQSHMVYLANLAHDNGVPVYIHALTDGRDTAPTSAHDFMADFMASAPHATLATVCGRYFAMDRDNNWQRTQACYDAVVSGQGENAPHALTLIKDSYAQHITDEFIPAHVIGNYGGVKLGDAMLMTHFRADRARQIMTAFAAPDFDKFPVRHGVFSSVTGMTDYSDSLKPHTQTLFPPQDLTHVLGEVLADNGISQLRVAETEKYAHVTFFLNGGREQPFAGEDRILLPSPKVATYDLQPTMASVEIGEAVTQAILAQQHQVIIVNFAAPDMVGHTGNLQAAITAVETVDTALGKMAHALAQVQGAMIVTADHGNCDMMVNPDTGQPHTAHTLFPVPVCLVSYDGTVSALRNGQLADLAPTVLALLGIAQPPQMSGQSLLM